MKTENTRPLLSLTFICAASLICLNNFPQPARAEGDKTFTGAQGVNRVIRCTSGANTTTSGTGSMNFTNIPPNGGRYVDKPSFYLGTTVGNDEVDAGLQYEPKIILPYAPGWTASISISRNGATAVYCNPDVIQSSNNQPISWRGGAIPATGKPISSAITSTVDYETHANGTVGVTLGILKSGGRVPIVANSGTSFHNRTTNAGTFADASSSPPHLIAPWYGAQPLTGNQNTATVKRVTAMTRDSGKSSNDGSQLTCTWSGAFGVTIDQVHTGYDAPGNGVAGQKDDRGSYKVNFPSLNVSEGVARTDTNPSRIATQTVGGIVYSRYDNETVSINLRNPLPRGVGH